MPRTAYGFLAAQRAHKIDSPQVASAFKSSKPNACNLCHLDQTLAWTANYLTEWHDQPPAALSTDEQEIAASLLWILKGDAVQRSVVGWHFGWSPAGQVSNQDWPAPLLAHLLENDYSAVRFIAEHSLKQWPGFEDFTRSLSDQAAVKQRVIQQWQESQQTADLPTGKRTLVNSDRTLMSAEIRRLLSQQDSSPVTLAE